MCRSWGDRGTARSRRRMRPGCEEQLDLLLEIPGQAARLLAADAGVIPAVPPDGRRETNMRRHEQKTSAVKNTAVSRDKPRRRTGKRTVLLVLSSPSTAFTTVLSLFHHPLMSRLFIS